MENFDIAIIGGGAAGLMAAIFTSSEYEHNKFSTHSEIQNTLKIALFEKNEKLGKKLYITGKGRCNVTNLGDSKDFDNNIIRGNKFLLSALSKFNNLAMVDFLNSQGLKTKVERGNRVFPLSDKSSDVINTLEKLVRKNGVKIFLNQNITSIEKFKDSYILCTHGNKYLVNSVILTTGGKSYSSTGSNGFGYELAKKLGHTIVELKPALAPINLKQSTKDLEGLSLKNVTAKIADAKNNIVVQEFGEMLFTNNGVSGPIILTLSSKINRIDLTGAKLIIDLKPALSEKTLDLKIIEAAKSKVYANKSIKNYIKSLLPSKMVDDFCAKIDFETHKKQCENDKKLCEIDKKSYKKLCEIDKNMRKTIINLLKNYQFDILNLSDIDYAIITSGGILTDEINPKTMESKICKNLYFAGEIIDCDALTGGYNLQIAFSTGVLAGKRAREKVLEMKL